MLVHSKLMDSHAQNLDMKVQVVCYYADYCVEVTWKLCFSRPAFFLLANLQSDVQMVL